MSVTTIEYPHAYEFGHVTAPGADYYEKYQEYFAKVKAFRSHDFPSKYQVFIYEDRTGGQRRNGPWLARWKRKNTLIWYLYVM